MDRRKKTLKLTLSLDLTQEINIDYDLDNVPEADLVASKDGRFFTATLTLTVEVLNEVKLSLKCKKTLLYSATLDVPMNPAV